MKKIQKPELSNFGWLIAVLCIVCRRMLCCNENPSWGGNLAFLLKEEETWSGSLLTSSLGTDNPVAGILTSSLLDIKSIKARILFRIIYNMP